MWATGAVLAGTAFGDDVLLKADFEHWLTPWQYWGDAEFGLDPQTRRSGAHSARIIAPDAKNADHPQMQYVVPEVSGGDRLRAEVWFRAKDVADRGNVVLAVEYFDCNGDRRGADRAAANKDAGGEDWNKISLAGQAPDAACAARACLILQSPGTVWFDDFVLVRETKGASRPDSGSAERTIVIRGDEIVQPRFGGVGYQTFITHNYAKQHFDQVVGKRWRELNPSFARVIHLRKRPPKKFDEDASRLAFLKTTGTEVYVVTDNAPDTENADQRNAYAKEIVDELECLVRQRGLTNIRYYCMSNEMSLRGWARMVGDMPKFKDYHRALFEELRARNLRVELLATDASPCAYWNTMHWAARNMDQYTGVYGGHHYISEFDLQDEKFYAWFLLKMKWAVEMAKAKNKDFILGEFGAKQDGRTIDGVIMDRCVYWDTPLEPAVPIQVAEAAVAAVNAGAYAMCYWTFMDVPSFPGAGYRNQWGLFRCEGDDHSTRPIYYAYGLLSKFFRGPAAVHRVVGDDPLLRIAAIRHHDRNTWSVAVVNRNRRAVPVGIRFPANVSKTSFRKYVYDPAGVTMHTFGDLPDPTGKIELADGSLNDTLSAGSLTVYTTAYDDQPPAAVEGLSVEKTENGKRHLRWKPNREPDFCYYRVYRSSKAQPGERQIASTIATEYLDERIGSDEECGYRIVAVDQSGNSR
ncbi:MAG: hypothetical protein JW959_06375 [Pirellulales bacterium]|nr:hypothetical protein [Pirellulales bacterium]